MNDNIKAEPNPLDTVEDIYEITVLLDFYGHLLTERQHEIMDLYFNSDLSLGEIAEELSISRQGVYDSIRKAKQALLEYEKKLGLVERFKEQEKNIEKALDSLKNMGRKSPELVKDSDYRQAIDLLEKMLDTL
ncbi:MAG: putative DNA-binding protein [Clostridiaceae bacterium]|nr:putative DNA-binding protein [Clostridiaceae bacterium]